MYHCLSTGDFTRSVLVEWNRGAEHTGPQGDGGSLNCLAEIRQYMLETLILKDGGFEFGIETLEHVSFG